MRNLYIIGTCSYTKAGFSALTNYRKMSDVNIISIETYDEMMQNLEESSGICTPSIIVIDMTVHLKKYRVKQLATIWNLRRIMYTNEKIRNLPFVLYGDNKQSILTTLYWMNSQEPIKKQINILDRLYSDSTYYIKRDEVQQKPLEGEHKIVLDKLMEGSSVQNLARKMNTNTHHIFYIRDQLMIKLGLNNRFDFTQLTNEQLL